MGAQATGATAGKTVRKIRIGTIYPATIVYCRHSCRKIARKYSDIQLQIQSGSTSDIICSLGSRMRFPLFN